MREIATSKYRGKAARQFGPRPVLANPNWIPDKTHWMNLDRTMPMTKSCLSLLETRALTFTGVIAFLENPTNHPVLLMLPVVLVHRVRGSCTKTFSGFPPSILVPGTSNQRQGIYLDETLKRSLYRETDRLTASSAISGTKGSLAAGHCCKLVNFASGTSTSAKLLSKYTPN